MDGFHQSFYVRPPPPPPPLPAIEPNLYNHHNLYQHHHPQLPPAPPRQHVPALVPWYSGQFQYVSEPLSSHPQWGAHPPPSDPVHPNPYSAHNPSPYHVVSPHQFHPIPPSHLPPQHHHQICPPYASSNQEHGNSNLSNHEAFDYTAYSNEEEWAAKARAWAAAKTSTDTQHLQDQFACVGKFDEHSHYRDQYPQSIDRNYSDFQHQPYPAANIQHYPIPPAPPQMPDVAHFQDPPIVPVSSSYVPNGHANYDVKAENLTGQLQAGYMCASSSKQEVPSSYSSASANGGQEVQKDSLHLHAPSSDIADQPLNFVPKFNHDYDHHMNASYANSDVMGSVNPTASGIIRCSESLTATVSGHTWTSNMQAPGYPSVLPAQQLDPSVVIPSLSCHPTSTFGRIHVPAPQPPPVNADFGHGAATPIHHAFSADIYAVPCVPERPKKASMPNWLREEIIKKKDVIVGSDKQPKEDSQSAEDDGLGKSSGIGDQADSRSMGSSKSNAEEEDYEDDVEAARTAAINQKIKRVLTDILLKVTDQIFDEIATKVLNEEDMTSEDQNIVNTHQSASPPAPKATAKVLIPVKPTEGKSDNEGERSSSSFPGDVLGLANYASDEDNDDVTSTSQPTNLAGKSPSKTNRAEKGNSDAEADQHTKHGIDAVGERSAETCRDDVDSHLNSNDDGEESIRGKVKHVDDTHMKKLSRDEVGRNDKCDKGSLKKIADLCECPKNNSIGKLKNHDLKHGEKVTESVKQSSRLDVKEDRVRTHRLNEHNKKDYSERREREKDAKNNRSRHKDVSDLSKHKRRHSTSSGSMSRNGNDTSPPSHSSRSKNDTSNNSKRKMYSARRKASPSPNRSGRRKLSRSPHSKHSHRNISSYSSNEPPRGVRARSRSPTRRRR